MRCSRDWSSDVCSSDLNRQRCCALSLGRHRVGVPPRVDDPAIVHSSAVGFSCGVVGTGEQLVKLRVRHVERSEEHTSELQSRLHLVCRLLLEKKKKKQRNKTRVKEEMIAEEL